MALLQLSADAAAAGDELGVGDEAAATPHGDGVGGVVGPPPRWAARRRRCARSTSPGFAGELRHYQRRGLGWMRFLARLGLGGCLADDMGLGKTATTLAHLARPPGPAPRRVPVVGRAQLGERGASLHPEDDRHVHHGAQRARRRRRRRSGAGAPDELVVTTYGLVTRDLDHLADVDWATVSPTRRSS